MAYGNTNLSFINFTNKNSSCPLCKDQTKQVDVAFGTPNVNFSLINAIAFGSKAHVQASLSYCSLCDFAYFFPVPSNEFLQEYYENGGHENTNIDIKQRFEDLETYSFTANSNQLFDCIKMAKTIDLTSNNQRTALEIGPGFSPQAKIIKQHGYEYWACEIGKEAVKFLENHFTKNVFNKPTEEISAEYQKFFDLVISKDSFEHHPNPFASIQKCIELLKPNGHLVITVPNFKSISFGMTSVLHPYFAFPAHLNYFSKKSFEVICNNLNAEIIYSQSMSFVGEHYYCSEMPIKLGLVSPEASVMNTLAKMDALERIVIILRKK